MKQLTIMAMALMASPVMAQSNAQAEYDAFRNCVDAKVATFAHLDGSISEIATAAIGACDTEKDALQYAYQVYAESLAPADAPKRSYGAAFIDATVEGLMPRLMASVAEARTN